MARPRRTDYPYNRTRLLDVLRETGRRSEWVARQMKVSRNYFSLVCNGRRPITERFVTEACRVLAMAETDLFFCEPSIPKRLEPIDTASPKELAS